MAFNSHYHTNDWMKAKEKEVLDRQSDPSYLFSLKFYRDANGWFADVPGHTRAQNRMVCGADKLIESFSNGLRCVEMKFRTVKSTDKDYKPMFSLKRVEHDCFGASYLAFGLSVLPLPAWLCNVTETVLGEHPKNIYVYCVNSYDINPKDVPGLG